MSKPPRGCSRPPLERMLRIHERLREGRDTTCRLLAGELEVSTKTVMRDIEFMRDRLGLPIEYDSFEYSYRYTSPVESFPAVQVSEGELVALLVAQKALEQYRGTPFEKTLETAFGKIASGLRDEVTYNEDAAGAAVSFRNIGVSTADLEVFTLAERAIRERRVLGFDYRKLGAAEVETRLVHPHHLACVQGLWYLVAHDPARDALRTFAMTRISQTKLGRDTFTRRADFDARAFFRNSFGVFSGAGTQEVRIQFSVTAAPLVRERFWHESQSIEEEADGSLVLVLQVGDLGEVLNWVLGWGARARVLAPESLARRVAEEAAALSKLYAQ